MTLSERSDSVTRPSSVSSGGESPRDPLALERADHPNPHDRPIEAAEEALMLGLRAMKSRKQIAADVVDAVSPYLRLGLPEGQSQPLSRSGIWAGSDPRYGDGQEK